MREIGNLQILRGLAALAVVAFHAQQELTWRHAPLPLPDLLAGAAGVDVFFAISGFIIVFASADLFGRPAAVAPFVWRRVARIVPLYWAASVACALYTWRCQLLPLDLHAIERWLARSLLFVPGPSNEPILSTGWTLNYEMFFYVAFAAVLPFRRRAACAALAAALAGYALAGALGALPASASALASPLLLEFIAGMALAELRLSGHRLPRRAATLLVWLGVAGIVAASGVDRPSWWAWRGLVWGVPAAAIVAGGALAREAPARFGAGRRALERLGDASFSIYIVHYTLFAALSRFALPLFPQGRIGAAAYFGALMVAAVAAGWAVHRSVERPLYRAMAGRRLSARPRRGQPMVSSAFAHSPADTSTTSPLAVHTRCVRTRWSG